MGQLFMLECKKTVTGIIYWLFVAALTFVFWLNYGNVDSEEINNAASPSSIFYCAQDGQYASEENSGQNQMMLAVTKRLLHCYRDNSYEYYPFGYIKEKVFSETEQNKVLQYLQEITGMERTVIEEDIREKISEEPGDSGAATDSENSISSFEIEISGPEAYVAKPGAGSMTETGKYVFQPGDWECIENPSDSPEEETVLTGENKKTDSIGKNEETSPVEKKKKAASVGENKETSPIEEDKKDSEFSIQVSYKRFMDIMDEISDMIGKNSYFSRSLINLYYGENDMDDSPITQEQHEEFYSRDKITGAFARYYCDSISLAILLLPAFVIAATMTGDKRNKVMELAYTKPISSFKLIVIRYLTAIAMMFVPILLLPVRSFIILAKYANAAGNAIDIFAFPKYCIGWILPTLLLTTALSLFLTVLMGSPASILIMGILSLFLRPSVGKIAGGNYELFDFAIRHNTLKGFGRMMQQFHRLVINRLFITAIAFLFVLLSVWIYQIRRKGDLSFNVQKFIHYHKREL